MANWGATPEEEKFEAAKLEALTHNVQMLTRILTAVNEEKNLSHIISIKRGVRGVVSFAGHGWSSTVPRASDVLHNNSGHRQRD